MPKLLLLSCVVFIGTTQLRAQVVQDTIREKIDYRLYRPLSPNKFKENTNRKNTKIKNFRPSKVPKNRIDTVRDSRDYRISSKSIKPIKVYSHYLGIQVNPILKRLSEDANGKIIQSNPHSFTYSFNHGKAGYGLGFGFGYSSSFNKTSISRIPSTETAQDKTSLRIGPQKQKFIGKHWIIGTGIDLLFSSGNEITKNFVGGLIQESNQKKVSYGFGPRATVQCAVWNKVRMGTEFCWYFEKLKTSYREKFTGLPTEHSRSNATSNTFISPVSLFIAVGIW